MKRLAILLALCLGPPLLAQTQSPYLYTPFTPWTATATSQTSPVMNIGDANRPYSYASGTVNVVGSSLTTVTFAVQGSMDQGATYNSLVIQTCGTAGGTSTTITLTANGCAWVNLAGIDHVKFVTSSTFTATSVVFTLRANPNVNNIGAATSGGATGQSATFNNGGTGAASGATFNGSAPVTISYNTLGAAPLASPTFTGVPAAPTAAVGTSTTQLATTAFVQASGASVVQLGAEITSAGTQSISNTTDTVLVLATTVRDNGGFVSGSHTNALTVPTGGAGWYTITGVTRSVASGGSRYLWILKNGSFLNAGSGFQLNGDLVQNASSVTYLADGDFIQLDVFQSSGGSVTYNAATTLSMKR